MKLHKSNSPGGTTTRTPKYNPCVGLLLNAVDLLSSRYRAVIGVLSYPTASYIYYVYIP